MWQGSILAVLSLSGAALWSHHECALLQVGNCLGMTMDVARTWNSNNQPTNTLGHPRPMIRDRNTNMKTTKQNILTRYSNFASRYFLMVSRVSGTALWRYVFKSLIICQHKTMSVSRSHKAPLLKHTVIHNNTRNGQHLMFKSLIIYQLDKIFTHTSVRVNSNHI